MADEKTEEKQEKEVEKREEKLEEKWQRDPLGSVIAAIILMWAGVVLLAQNMGYASTLTGILDSIGFPEWDLPFDWTFSLVGWRTLQAFLLGTGVIVVIEVIIRLIVARFRRNVVGSFIGAIVCFAIAFGNWEVIWPLVIIAIGLSILVGALTGRRRRRL
jgi:hypothetical protein